MLVQVDDASNELRMWARAIVRAIEDAGLEGEVVHREALKLLDEMRDLAMSHPRILSGAWFRCDVPGLRAWARDCDRLGRHERARMYEAIVAVRLAAAEVAEMRTL